MSLESLLKDYAGQTDADVEDEANRIEVSQVVADLIRRLKQKLIDKASSEDEVEKIEKDSKNGCSFFAGKIEDLADLLEEDLRNGRGIPFSPPVMRKTECGCEDHYFAWYMVPNHSEYGCVKKLVSRDTVVRIHQNAWSSENYNPNEYFFVPCGFTMEEIEDYISGKEESIAKDLARSHSDWCTDSGHSSGDAKGEGGGDGINQIPGYPGSCKEELRVLVPLKAVVTWKRLEETASLLIRCSTIHTLGFVIGEESSGTGVKFKRVWKQFCDDGNLTRLPTEVGLIIANGDASEKIQRWDGSKWS